MSRRGQGVRTHAMVLAVAAVALGLQMAPITVAAADPPGSTASPTGDQPHAVQWLAISPQFAQSGLVAAVGLEPNCSTACNALWISLDGGHAWRRAAAKGWLPRRVTIAVDGTGHDVLYGPADRLLMRSDDLGETFHPAGDTGSPTVLPSFGRDGGMVVASLGRRSDYVVYNGAAHDLTGAGNLGTSLAYAVAPGYPNAGPYSPALLTILRAHSGAPAVMRCTADFTCSDGATLAQAVASDVVAPSTTSLLLADDYAQTGSVFADTPAGVLKSTDGAHTFTPLTIVSPAQGTVVRTPMMALAPGYREEGPNRTAYVAVAELNLGLSGARPQTAGGIYKTVDGGGTWMALNSGGPFASGASAVAVAPDGRMFASGGTGSVEGLYCSADNGVTWERSCPAEGHASPVRSVASPQVSDATSSATNVVPTATKQASTLSSAWPVAIGVAVIAGGAGWFIVARRRPRRRTG